MPHWNSATFPCPPTWLAESPNQLGIQTGKLSKNLYGKTSINGGFEGQIIYKSLSEGL